MDEPTIDGVKIEKGDRILYFDSGPRWWHPIRRWKWRRRPRTENGVYVVTATSSWERHP